MHGLHNIVGFFNSFLDVFFNPEAFGWVKRTSGTEMLGLTCAVIANPNNTLQVLLAATLTKCGGVVDGDNGVAHG